MRLRRTGRGTAAIIWGDREPRLVGVACQRSMREGWVSPTSCFAGEAGWFRGMPTAVVIPAPASLRRVGGGPVCVRTFFFPLVFFLEQRNKRWPTYCPRPSHIDVTKRRLAPCRPKCTAGG